MPSDTRIERVIQSLPVLPLRAGVLLPHQVMPISVGRAYSEKAVEAALASEEKRVFVVTVKNEDTDEPSGDDLFEVGTIAVITQMQRMQQIPLVQLLVTGMTRARAKHYEMKDGHIVADVKPWPLPAEESAELEGLRRAVLGLADQAAHLAEPKTPIDLEAMLGTDATVEKTAFFLTSIFSFTPDKVRIVLESENARSALERLEKLLRHEITVLRIRNRIASRTADVMSEQQRRHILQEQLEMIRQELGEQSPEEAELSLLKTRIAETELPDDAKKEVERELERLQRLPGASQERHVIRDRLDLILELPWFETTSATVDIDAARKTLEADHHGLEDVKDRILEHLGVLTLKPDAKSPILCFVGPPGVGKTSVGHSIARALGRKFERMSLGGMHDEAELRGHRRTYVGAIPGRIIQAIRTVGTKDPVLMLDEIDKLGRDFRGDPAAALLEVLDPEQHSTFHDNYLDLPFDLSQVFFITTANTLDTIPKPLLDRMEILRLPGYTDTDKLEIAKRFLVPRQLERAGLTSADLEIRDEAILEIAARYTWEAGVRQIEQRLGALARKVALRCAEKSCDGVIVRREDVAGFLGPPRYAKERHRPTLAPGVAAGLAWTEAGGDVLYVEASELPKQRGLVLTGSLGEVMKESAQAAHSYLWANANTLGLDRAKVENTGVHVHVPAGATPKDGPSAGVAMATAMASLLLGISARADTAMTGEMTLTGLVLPVGGVREKVLGAVRLGIRHVILPAENETDLEKLPAKVRSAVRFTFVERIDQVIDAALEKKTLAAA